MEGKGSIESPYREIVSGISESSPRFINSIMLGTGILVGFLVILNLYTVLRHTPQEVQLSTPRSRNIPKTKSVDKSPKNSAALTTDEQRESSVPPVGVDFVYPDAQMRNPFEPGNSTVEKPPQVHSPASTPFLMLTGIIWDEKSPIAILSDRKESYTAKVDDVVLSFKVLAIHKRSVILERKGKQMELKLWTDKEINPFTP
ncbi:MAG: hypothetical protein ACE5PV_05540 [Candidatus Poribacteria bacterium]